MYPDLTEDKLKSVIGDLLFGKEPLATYKMVYLDLGSGNIHDFPQEVVASVNMKEIRSEFENFHNEITKSFKQIIL